MLVFLFVTLALSGISASSSFYDNPEQDPILPPISDDAEELHRKWDFEVLPLINACFQCGVRLKISSSLFLALVGLLWNLSFCTLKA